MLTFLRGENFEMEICWAGGKKKCFLTGASLNFHSASSQRDSHFRIKPAALNRGSSEYTFSVYEDSG